MQNTKGAAEIIHQSKEQIRVRLLFFWTMGFIESITSKILSCKRDKPFDLLFFDPLDPNSTNENFPKKSSQSILSLYTAVTSRKNSEKYHAFRKLEKLHFGTISGTFWPKIFNTKKFSKKKKKKKSKSIFKSLCL